MINDEIIKYYDCLMRLAMSKCNSQANAEDSVNKVWHVRGSLSFGVRLGHFLGDRSFKGGVAHFIFSESDGHILAVWHDK